MRIPVARKTKIPLATLIRERSDINGALSKPASGKPNPEVIILKTGATKREEATPIRTIKATEMNWGIIIDFSTSAAPDVFWDLGCPRNVIPNALVKQNIASPPIDARATIEPRMKIEI